MNRPRSKPPRNLRPGDSSKETVLVFQIASLGDTVVSLPTYREIARRHPTAQLVFLTNFPVGQKMVSAEQILQPLGIFAGCLEYPMPLRKLDSIVKLHHSIRKLRAVKLYYLLAEKKTTSLARHLTFFKACGIPSIEGIPWSRDLRFPRQILPGQQWESEASRLLRTIGARAEAGPAPEGDRALGITTSERTKAAASLDKAGIDRRFVAVSVGGKIPINDWGNENWGQLLTKLGVERSDLALVLVGSSDEWARNEELSRSWPGKAFNACGLFTPRETAALLEKASLFVGHDTGTLHLAAAVRTPVLGIFSARNVPGKWFSDRPNDTFLYRKVECMGCEAVELSGCSKNRKCIMSITPHEVLNNALGMLTVQNNQEDSPA